MPSLPPIRYHVLMTDKARTILNVTLGVILIIVGLSGMVLPVLPGWWVILLGLHLLGWRLVIKPREPWFKKYRLKREKKK